MKKLKEILLGGTGFATVIMILYYLIANLVIGATGGDAVEVSGGRFMMILAFGMLISVANYFYSIMSLNIAVRVIIHYALTLVGFALVFIVGQSMEGHNPGAYVFSRIIIFTAFYFVFAGAVALIKHLIGKDAQSTKNTGTTKTTGRKAPAAQKSAKTKPEEAYTPRYKS